MLYTFNITAKIMTINWRTKSTQLLVVAAPHQLSEMVFPYVRVKVLCEVVWK
jgi:hypothetical protein